MSELSMTMSRHLLASPEAVFDAWITPSSMAQWLSPMTTADVPRLDLRVGGEYQIDMHGEGEIYVHTGKYLEIDRPHRLVFTWQSEGTGQQETVVTLEMKAEGDGTAFTLTHERFPNAESRDNHEKGWNAIVAKLEGVLAGAKA
ncbi:MAG: SRPBCC domain-containing protein [Candidatus Krumholzibacteria bacterium]|nr:SRPBCC domain-containing protein [Candidatus Krumholzibacteria bacterium]